MHGPYPSIAQDETAWTTWIVRVVLQDFSGRDDLFEVEDVEILREPLLLGVDAEFIAFTLDEAWGPSWWWRPWPSPTGR